MGNWMTVNIVGTCSDQDLRALENACDAGEGLDNFHCLCFYSPPSICGLNKWPATKMNVVGNLAERDYTIESVAKQCQILAAAAPSLSIDVHCGGDNEDSECSATVRVRDGLVEILPPQIKQLPEIDTSQMQSNFLRAISR